VCVCAYVCISAFVRVHACVCLYLCASAPTPLLTLPLSLQVLTSTAKTLPASLQPSLLPPPPTLLCSCWATTARRCVCGGGGWCTHGPCNCHMSQYHTLLRNGHTSHTSHAHLSRVMQEHETLDRTDTALPGLQEPFALQVLALHKPGRCWLRLGCNPHHICVTFGWVVTLTNVTSTTCHVTCSSAPCNTHPNSCNV